jgi:hypothetical protein
MTTYLEEQVLSLGLRKRKCSRLVLRLRRKESAATVAAMKRQVVTGA